MKRIIILLAALTATTVCTAQDSLVTRYRRTHTPSIVPVGKHELRCALCNFVTTAPEGVVFSENYDSDTLIGISTEYRFTGKPYYKYHKFALDDIKTDPLFRLHLAAFANEKKAPLTNDVIEFVNAHEHDRSLDEVALVHPFAYISHSQMTMTEDGGVGFAMEIINTSNRKINLVKVTLDLLNADRTVKTSKVYHGEGIIKRHQAHSWIWDITDKLTAAGDVANVRPSRITLVYADGSQQTLDADDINHDGEDLPAQLIRIESEGNYPTPEELKTAGF